MAYRRSTTSSIFDAFSLNPLPYPVLLILAMISIFLGTSWYLSYEEAVESAEEQMGWLLLATPIALLILVRWLSSMENPDFLFSMSPWDQRRRTHHRPSEGSSPWGVAALIVLLLVMVQYRSVFTDGWLVQIYRTMRYMRIYAVIETDQFVDSLEKWSLCFVRVKTGYIDIMIIYMTVIYIYIYIYIVKDDEL